MKNNTKYLRKEEKLMFALLYALVFFLLAIALTLELACPDWSDLDSILRELLW